MNVILFERYSVPRTLLHAEIIKNVDYVWPDRLNFNEVFLLHLPVTQNLISHCMELVAQRNFDKLKQFSELEPFVTSNDPKMLLQIRLNKIIDIESALSPGGLTKSEQLWVDQMLCVAEKYPEQVTLRDSNQIEVKVENDFSNPRIIIKMKEAFPNVSPEFDGTFGGCLTSMWTKNVTITDIVTKFIELTTKLNEVYVELFEFTQPQTFLRLIHPETQKTLRSGELHYLQFDPVLPTILIVPMCIIPVSEHENPVYIRIWIDTRSPEEFPQRIEAPKEFYNVDKWSSDKTLSVNLKEFFMCEDKNDSENLNDF